VFEAAYRVGYDLVVVTLTRLPYVVAIMAAVVLTYLAYKLRVGPSKRGAWPAIFAVLALYGFLAALAPAGWDEPLVLLGVTFAALAGYALLDPARKATSAGAAGRSGERGWFG
jgi:phosphatidylglycerophosphate synthase